MCGFILKARTVPLISSYKIVVGEELKVTSPTSISSQVSMHTSITNTSPVHKRKNEIKSMSTDQHIKSWMSFHPFTQENSINTADNLLEYQHRAMVTK